MQSPVPGTVPTRQQGLRLNTTSYSLIPGLGAAGSATLLFLVGLFVGLVAAWSVSRAMYKPKVSGPVPASTEAQIRPECPVCHEMFPTENELKQHSKSAHGILM